jgi:glycosyltransferase involved in cell wall biosynthesis
VSSQSATELEIFIPFWGSPELLDATVDSVRAQTSDRWTVTIVDDQYPDPTVGERYSVDPDPRIRYLRNEVNLGTTDNYDRCRELDTGTLMMFLGCDDLLHPDFVATVLAGHEKFPRASIIQPGVTIIDEHGRPTAPLTDRVKRAIMPKSDHPLVLAGEPLATSLLHGNWLYWPSLVFRTEAVRRFPFREGLPIIQDLALVIDMVASGESLLLEPTVCFSYRRHTESVSAASLFSGRRFADERAYYASAVTQMTTRGWPRAARAARLRWTSRLHGTALLPTAARKRQWSAFKPLLTHFVKP